jgi:hypothetical protein
VWQLKNQTPYAADRCFVRDRRGAETWVVLVKATFTLQEDGTTALADRQEELCSAPQYQGKPGLSSLLYDTDFALKPATDVLLHGHAYAPGRKPAPHVDVELSVGTVSKRLRVFGDRLWQKSNRGLVPSRPEPLVTLPIAYERAFGGVLPPPRGSMPAWEQRNPVGTGYAATPDLLEGRQCPNIEDPRTLISAWDDRPSPAGFGPIARDWAPRRAFAGTYDHRWEIERAPLPPDDFDDRFYLCAPVDQQVQGFLKGGEPVVLLNLSPAHAELRFSLPKIRLAFQTRLGREEVEHRAALSTVLIEPDASRVLITWCTALPCQGSEHMLERTRIFEKRFLR